MRRRTTIRLALAAALALPAGLAPASGAVAHGGRPAAYTLPGDPTGDGSKYEGIGFDRRTGAFYVSETTGGEISRGDVREPVARPWLPGNGADGRWTARGVEVDEQGRVFVAGGPNALDHPGAPDLWAYDRAGRLLAALRTGAAGAFLNDVAIGADGAAYVTDSTAPRIFRVARDGGRWTVRTWLDATGTIDTAPGFNLGGIVVFRDALLVAQGNLGRLWRVDLATRAVTRVDLGGPDLTNADGLVLRGRELTAIRNFSPALTTVRLDGDGATARPVADRPTDPDRVLTTGEIARGRLLAVDSKFDENPARPPYQVVVLRLP